jgi:hypothetical protein
MIMIFREHSCNISIPLTGPFQLLANLIQLPLYLASCILLGLLLSCKQAGPVAFCEGIDTQGKGINCGTKFSTGDLTGVITVQERFETESIRVAVSRKTRYKNDRVSDFTQKVTSEYSTATVPLSFYIEGDYVVEVFGKDDRLLGSGNITVVDTY